jgi:hypothetical protein
LQIKVTLMMLLTGPRGREGGEIVHRELGGILGGMPPTIVRRTSGVQCYIGSITLRTRTRTLAATARGCAR